MSEPKTYTATDIERYHRGEMPPAERHLLEKAALDDPMLADMLDGYGFTTSAQADLQTLQQRLQQRLQKEDENRPGVVWMQWLKVAAVLLIVVGSGWLVFRMFSPGPTKLAVQTVAPAERNVAVRKDTASSPQQTLVPSLMTDSASTMNDVAVNTPKPQRKKTAAVGQIQSSPVRQSDEQIAVVATETLPITAMAAPRADELKIDSNRQVAGLTARTAAPALKNDTIQNVRVVLQPLDQPLSEVVVTSANLKRARAARPPVSVDTLEPAQGWRSFNDYIAENLQAPDEIKEKQVAEGEVELRFSVDRDGNPTNIKITKSLCEKCDAEAIRLLKEGPKWKGKKGKVRLKFSLSR